MTSRPSFDMRLRQYTPLGGQAGIIPDLGITLNSTPEGGTLQATVTTLVAGSLPNDCEVAVEVWNAAANGWVEGRDSRFVLLTHDVNDRDRSGVVTLTGIALMAWLGQKAALAGVKPYLVTGCNVEAAASTTALSVSGSTFTWSGHILGEGDRVHITKKAKAKALTAGVYFVRNPSGSTFQISHTATGAIKTGMGTHGGLSAERVRTRIVMPAGHSFTKNQAVTVQDAAGSNLTDGTLYYVVNPTASTIQVASKPGGLPLELKANALNVYRYLDGQRVWKNATPGTIMSDAFLEARDRGWGQDAAGTDQVFHSWTVAADTDSYAWKARVDDPTVTGVSIGFQPGTALSTMLQFLVDNDWAEWSSIGRTLDLRNVNSGADWTTTGARRIGTAASQVQVVKDLTDYRTAITVRGTGPVEETVTVGRSPWGRLETYVQAQGVGSKAHARTYGRGDLAKYGTASVGYVVTEAAQEAAWLPILDYQRGDWVEVQVQGVWTRLRVLGWSLAKAGALVTVTVTLQKRKRAALHRLAKGHHAAHAGRSTISHGHVQERDKRKGAKPTALTVTSTTVYAADKRSKATLKVTWSPVTTDGDGDDLAATGYEVWVRSEGEQHGHAVARTAGQSAEVTHLPTGHLVAVSVRAQSSEGTWGELSDEVEHTLAVVDNPPNPPSTPAVTSTLGSMRVAWDGNLVDAEAGAGLPTSDDALAYVYAERATAAAGPWAMVGAHMQAAGSITDLGLTVGTTYWYRLTAVDALGQVSAPSATASVVLVGIDVTQINAAFKASMDSAASTASSAQAIANTANAAATGAQATADRKNTVYYADSAPTAPASGFATGDLWFETDQGNKPWRWSGTAWAAAPFSAAAVTNLDAGSITTGSLKASLIAAGSIAASQLAVADFTNLFENPNFANDVPASWGQAIRGIATNANARIEAPGGIQGLSVRGNGGTGNTDVMAAVMVPCLTGDQFYAQWDARTLATTGGGSMRAQIKFLKADQTTIAGWVTFRSDVAQSAMSSSAWVTYSGAATAPSGSAWAILDLSLVNGGANTNCLYYTNVLWRRKNTGVLVVDGTIDTNHLNATAIDGMTVTGATIQTASTAKTSGGVILNSSGITGYNASGAATFTVNNAGALTATGATITGAITASSGSVTGTLTIGSNGGIVTGTTYPRTRFDTHGLTFDQTSTFNVTVGQIDASHIGSIWNNGASVLAEQYVDTSGNMVLFANAQVKLSGTSVTAPSVYSNTGVVSGRAVVVDSGGNLGNTSSSERVKNLTQHVAMDDTSLAAWLGLATWQYAYKVDPAQKQTLGVVAEEVAAAGFTDLVYYDQRTVEEGGVPGQVDGFAYERMGVYNHLALKRLYARLMAAESRLAALEGAAAA